MPFSFLDLSLYPPESPHPPEADRYQASIAQLAMTHPFTETIISFY